jgi:hypothetical protein
MAFFPLPSTFHGAIDCSITKRLFAPFFFNLHVTPEGNEVRRVHTTAGVLVGGCGLVSIFPYKIIVVSATAARRVRLCGTIYLVDKGAQTSAPTATPTTAGPTTVPTQVRALRPGYTYVYNRRLSFVFTYALRPEAYRHSHEATYAAADHSKCTT